MLRFIVVVALVHLIAGALLVTAQHSWPMIAGFAGVAYVLGMRHGFDADHIVAIDGTTRHLLSKRKNANGVGLYFSLGHSTVVLLLAMWIANAAQTARRELPLLRALGGEIGLATSSLFMLLMAVLNVVIFRDTLRASRAGDGPQASDRARIGEGGLMSRIFGRALHLVRRAPEMYVVGFLFGLGFDTASEIALLAIAATAAAHALPIGAVLVLPLSFAAGMALVDTAEGFLMVRAYGWAQDQPTRRARYNLIVTGFTAVAAVMIGALELTGALGFPGPSDSAAISALVVLSIPILWFGAMAFARIRSTRAAAAAVDM